MEADDDAAEENGQLLTVQVRKLYQPESSNNSSDSEGDDFQGPRRKKAERGPQRGGKLFGDRNSGRGKATLIFSPSSSHENGRGRGNRETRGRSFRSEDREDGASYSSRKNFRSKVYEKGGDQENFAPEDGKIGRQLRLLSRETDEDVIIKICQQLQELFFLQDNLRYVRYNLITIANSLIEALKLVTSSQTRREISLTISRLGFVSDHDFHSFAKWILHMYQKESNEKICCSLMDSLNEMLKLDEVNPRLKSVDTLLLPGLQNALETADTSELFEAAMNPVLMIAIKHPASFQPYFRDTVDILVGWFIDPSQPAKVSRSSSKFLQVLRPFWAEDLPFSKTLLSQFLEDLDAFTEEAKSVFELSSSSDEESQNLCLRKISSLLNVFTVVGTQVCSYPDVNIYSAAFLNSALVKASQCVANLFDSPAKSSEAFGDIIQFGNECLSLLIGWLGVRIVSESLEPCLELLAIQLKAAASSFEYPLLLSILKLMTILIEQSSVASQLTVETIQQWMELSRWLVNSTQRRDVLSHVALLLRSLIKLKKVPLLIEVYRCIVADLDQSFKDLKTESSGLASWTEENAILLLSPLAELGRSTNFVGMWALEPSLLDLLAGKLQSVSEIKFLSSNHPTLLLGLLKVVHGHAKSSGFFVANSCLLSSSLHGCTSPTSGNLSKILTLLTSLCSELGRTSSNSNGDLGSDSGAKVLLMQWIGQLLDTCKPCTAQLNQSEIFQRFLESAVELCTCVPSHAVESVLSALLDLPEITLKTELAVRICQTCIKQLRNNPTAGRPLQLLARCPPAIVREAIRRVSDELLATSWLSSWIQQNGETAISSRSGQQFFEHILKGTVIASFESFYSFQHTGMKSDTIRPPKCDLPLWLAVQSALLCVNSKLRSPLGKPQDTFLAIESALKLAAINNPSETETMTEQNLSQLSRVRLLISFYEMLEKFMTNAFDGCSVALPLAPKLIRVFFRTNQTTCQEWMNRQSNVALVSSLRAGRYASAARYGLQLITRWGETGRSVPDLVDVERVLHQLTESLVKLKASQSIRGLKIWMSNHANLSQKLDLTFLDAAALQADSKHEEAIGLLNNRPSSSFACNQIISSYAALSDWDALKDWKSRIALEWPDAFCFLTAQSVGSKETAELLEVFDRGVHLQWPEKSTTDAQWTTENLLAEAKSGMLVAADRIRSSRSVYSAPTSTWKIIDHLACSSLQLSDLSSGAAGEATGDITCWLPLAHALSHRNDSAFHWTEHTRSVLKTASCTQLSLPSSAAGLEWSRWLQWYGHLDKAADLHNYRISVNLSTIKLARKEGNLRLAERLLLHELSGGHQHYQPGSLATQLMNEALKMKLDSSTSARLAIKLQFQGAKLLHQKGDTEAAISVLTQCSLALSRSLQSRASSATQESIVLPFMAESYTQLAKWLDRSMTQSSTPLKNVDTLRELANMEAVPGHQRSQQHLQEHQYGLLVSRLMERASQFCPSSAEAWLAWGQFQYAGAQRNIEPEIIIPHLLTSIMSPEEVSRVVLTTDELIGGVERALSNEPFLTKKPSVLKRLLLEVQDRRSTSLVGFKGALSAFFRYLNLVGSGLSSVSSRDATDVTLRILHILNRHLEDKTEELAIGIERTPPSSWQSITPQLISLLQQHDRPWFRQLISQLLSRLALERPRLLVFPIAVGAAGLAFSSSPSSNKGLRDNYCSAAELKVTYQSIIDLMAVQVPEMVADVQLLLSELRRLVLLRDELWVAVLQLLHPQVEQLLLKFQAQTAKLQREKKIDVSKSNVLQQHFKILFDPVIMVLEAVAGITCSPAETPHETWFQQRYSKTVNDGLEQLRHPLSLLANPQELWHPFKNMLQQLQHINYRRSLLKLDDVSPTLKAMKDSKVPMPGVDKAICVGSIDNHVVILPTKTKPKKLILIGSDGKRYAYLFKGMEDLHLDQRIMQVLSLTNVLLQADGFKAKSGYRARHYGVIPLGPRSGLIQWVDGVTPLFALYKRWLQRQAVASNSAAMQGAKGEKDNNSATTVPRPSELFYAKLTPLLEAEGLSADPRQRAQWPIETLRRVLADLMEETPKDLVSRELWLGSLNAEQWWSSTLRFSRSCAVMSVIGYVIGLGDRHLDNVLVDLRCGEVVHIDYNVCFEKGRQLRVPEKVPFRLTANIQHALGAAGTGLEGTFRLSCVNVLRVLRENRHLLEILLEHFVYDPLIDWRSSSSSHDSALIPLYVVNPSLAADCGNRKRRAELDATQELFRLRTSELGADWSSNHHQMLITLTSLKETTDAWISIHRILVQLQEELHDMHQDRLALFNVRSDQNHVMRQPQQLQAILLPLRTAWEGERTVRLRLKDLIEDNSKWISLYQMAFSSLSTSQLHQWTKAIGPEGEEAGTGSSETGFPLVSDFLTTSGQTSLAHQGQALEMQVHTLKSKLQSSASVVVSLLGSYVSLSTQYPLTGKLDRHRTQLMYIWAKELDQNMSSETCQQLVAAFQDQFDSESVLSVARRQRVIDFNLSLRRLINEATLRLHRASMELKEDDLNSNANEFLDTKETLSNYMILHGQKPIHYALLNRLCQTYQELELLDDETYCFTNQSALCGSAACSAEILAYSEEEAIQEGVITFQLLWQVHQDVQEFVFNGTTILLPEIVGLFQCGDSGIIQLHEDLEALSIDINLSKMNSTNLRFNELLGQGDEEDDTNLTRSQMLLQGLNGLFEKMESDIVEWARRAKLDNNWPQLNILIEAREKLDPELFNSQLESVLFAQRLRLMTSIFQTCANWSDGFEIGQSSLQQVDSLIEIFEHTAACWTTQFLPGTTGLCILQLCHRLNPTIEQTSSVEDLITASRRLMLTSLDQDEEVAKQACQLLDSINAQWREGEKLKLAHQRQELDRGLVQMLQQQLTSHSWVHHDAHVGINSPTPCGLFMINLNQSLSVLLSQSPLLTDIHHQITQLANQVEQRLKWAAGANPNLLQILQNFQSVQAKCLEHLQEYSALATSLGSVGSAILHYESFRTRSQEAITSDSAFIEILSQCQDVCLLKDCGTNGRLSECEVRLAQRVAPLQQEIEESSDEWIGRAEKALTESIAAVKEQISELQGNQNTCADRLRQINSAIRGTLTVHHQLISDVRSVLKTMAKCESENGPVTQYLEKYREFSELCSSASRHLSAKDYDLVKMIEIQSEINQLHSIIGFIYVGLEQLFGISVNNAEETTFVNPKRRSEVNSVAASVWHRVRMKLEGKDVDRNAKQTVEEQIDIIIEEATNLDNLALLYEGWTPWV